MFEYLAERTALLPEITRTKNPPKIGTTTEKAMQLGAYLGYRGMVGETFRYLVERYNAPNLTLVATGGDHEWVVKGFDPPVISDHTLTLFGLGMIYQLNRMDV
jgi:type III pantothenate kinase